VPVPGLALVRASVPVLAQQQLALGLGLVLLALALFAFAALFGGGRHHHGTRVPLRLYQDWPVELLRLTP